MSVLFCPIGISGSGKTRLGGFMQKVDPSIAVICPDDVRKEFTGNVSDQSRNFEVFKECYRRLEEALSKGNDAYFSATNLNSSDRKKLFEIAEKHGARINAIVLNDSDYPDVCEERVRKDLECGVDRSDTLVLREGNSVVQAQYKKFQALQLSKEPFENVFDFWTQDGYVKAKNIYYTVHEKDRPTMRVVWYDRGAGKCLPEIAFLCEVEMPPRNEAELIAITDAIRAIKQVADPVCLSFDMVN